MKCNFDHIERNQNLTALRQDLMKIHLVNKNNDVVVEISVCEDVIPDDMLNELRLLALSAFEAGYKQCQSDLQKQLGLNQDS